MSSRGEGSRKSGIKGSGSGAGVVVDGLGVVVDKVDVVDGAGVVEAGVDEVDGVLGVEGRTGPGRTGPGCG